MRRKDRSRRTTAPTTALTLLYDRDWKVDTYRLGEYTSHSFVTPAFTPDLASSVEELGMSIDFCRRAWRTPDTRVCDC